MNINKILKSFCNISTVILVAFFVSCSNFQSPEKKQNSEAELYTVKGSLIVSDALPSELIAASPSLSRTATSSFAAGDAEVKYDVIAYGFDETTFKGEVDPENLTYQIALPKGEWNIDVTKYIGDVSLRGYIDVEMTGTENLEGKNIVLTPEFEQWEESESGDYERISGALMLEMKDATYSEENGGKLASLSYFINEGDSGEKKEYVSFENGKVVLSIPSIQPGNYKFLFEFNDKDGNLLYSCVENIMVFSGFTTDTWVGNSSYLTSSGNFVITSDLIEKFGTETVPNTQTVVYEYSYDGVNDKDTYNLWEMNEDGSVSSTLLANSDLSEFDFDNNGDMYALSTADKTLDDANYKYINIVSNRTDITDPLTTISYGINDTYLLSIDHVNNDMWIYHEFVDGSMETQREFYIYRNVDKIKDFSPVTNPDSNPDAKPVPEQISMHNFNCEDGAANFEQFTVNNGLIYIVANHKNYTTEKVRKFLFRVNPSENGESSSFDIDGGEIDLKPGDLEIGENHSATDIVYQDGAVYVLFNDTEDSPDQAHSRGVLIKYDFNFDTLKHTGWNGEGHSLDDSFTACGYFSPNGGSDGYMYIRNNTGTETNPVYEYTPALLEFDYNNDYDYTVYAPFKVSNMNDFNFFVGPRKFVAIKPKKLVILDSGIAIYTDITTGALCYKKVNRIVEVDLETLSLSPHSETTGRNFIKESEYPEPGILSGGYFEKYIEDTEFTLDFVVKKSDGNWGEINGSGYHPIIISAEALENLK